MTPADVSRCTWPITAEALRLAARAEPRRRRLRRTMPTKAWISTGRPTAREATEYLLLSKRTRQVLETDACVAWNPSNGRESAPAAAAPPRKPARSCGRPVRDACALWRRRHIDRATRRSAPPPGPRFARPEDRLRSPPAAAG